MRHNNARRRPLYRIYESSGRLPTKNLEEFFGRRFELALEEAHSHVMIEAICANERSFGKAGRKANAEAVTVPLRSDERGGEGEKPSLWNELGLPEPPFLDEGRAPPVERELIRQMVRHELSEDREKAIGELVVLFKSWSDAHREIIREEMKRRRED